MSEDPSWQYEPTSESAEQAYDKIDRFLRNNLDDTDYADFSAALDLVYADTTQLQDAKPTAQTADARQEPVAKLHIRSTDTYLEADVEVLNGERLQPENSPVLVYLAPPADARDAERYRWLREHSYMDTTDHNDCIWYGEGIKQSRPDILDGRIDAAIAAGTGEGK